MIKRVFLTSALLVAMLGCCLAENRYPQYLPEWLWQSGSRYDYIMGSEARQKAIDTLKAAEQLNVPDDPKRMEAYWKKIEEARTIIHAEYSDLNFAKETAVVVDPSTQQSLALQLDPNFPKEMVPVLQQAAALYLSSATREDIVTEAFNDAIEEAQPFPEKQINGEVNDQYLLYAESLSKPVSVQRFVEQMKHVLAAPDGASRLLIVSTYELEPWWGGGLYGIYHDPQYSLARSHPNNFLYIRLNLLKMKPGQARWDDPKFWASKLAHEILHNIGYWHPPFKDPAERDKYSQPGKKAFIVAYEQAILKALDK